MKPPSCEPFWSVVAPTAALYGLPAALIDAMNSRRPKLLIRNNETTSQTIDATVTAMNKPFRVPLATQEKFLKSAVNKTARQVTKMLRGAIQESRADSFCIPS